MSSESSLSLFSPDQHGVVYNTEIKFRYTNNREYREALRELFNMNNAAQKDDDRHDDDRHDDDLLAVEEDAEETRDSSGGGSGDDDEERQREEEDDEETRGSSGGGDDDDDDERQREEEDDEETRDEQNYDERMCCKMMDFVYSKTRSHPLFIELYTLGAAAMMSVDQEIGLVVLFAYDYLPFFHPILCDFIRGGFDAAFPVHADECANVQCLRAKLTA